MHWPGRCWPWMAELPPDAEALVGADEVQAALAQMAAPLQAEIDAGNCVLLVVMLGGLVPGAWLLQRLHGDFELDYCHVTRYAGRQRGGEPRWLQPPRARLADRTVLIVDDIFDEGITLDYVVEACRELGAARVLTAVLVEKRHARAVARRTPDIVGLSVPDRYVFGCGMDLERRWRHLPAIYALAEEH
jgi:hypoxanthine phosphoribosyltransferase